MVLICVVFLNVPAVRGQAGPVEGEHEWQVWTGGGHGLNGSQSSDGVWNVGLRYGLILTAPHGPGFLRGRLEYAIDAVPVFLVTEKTNTAYGAGINPFAFKWALATHGSVVPHERRRSGPSLSAQQAQHQRGTPIHAYFERRPCNSESRHQHPSASFGLWSVQPKRVAARKARA